MLSLFDDLMDVVPPLSVIRKSRPKPRYDPYIEQPSFDAVRVHVDAMEEKLARMSLEARLALSRELWPDETVDPKRISVMWEAVIERAYSDAISLDMLICNDEHGEESEATQMRALDWFRKGGKNFDDVCIMADRNPASVKDSAIARFKAFGILRENGTINADYIGMSYGKMHERMKDEGDV